MWHTSWLSNTLHSSPNWVKENKWLHLTQSHLKLLCESTFILLQTHQHNRVPWSLRTFCVKMNVTAIEHFSVFQFELRQQTWYRLPTTVQTIRCSNDTKSFILEFVLYENVVKSIFDSFVHPEKNRISNILQKTYFYVKQMLFEKINIPLFVNTCMKRFEMWVPSGTVRKMS